jgi:pimeloyl-ACP methyl ester carboxylesterase
VVVRWGTRLLVIALCAALATPPLEADAKPKRKAPAAISLLKIPRPKPAPARVNGVPVPKEVHAKLRPLANAITKLVAFDISPFPFDGAKPNEGAFLNVMASGRRGHTSRAGVYWEDTTYSDRRVLISIPKGFDIRKPATMVVFFHGNGATLERDVAARQKVPQQLAAAGVNAVLVAPQFAVDAMDSSAGSFWQPGTFRQFLDEAIVRLTEQYGDVRTRDKFAAMPVVLVAYSGGYMPAAWSLYAGQANERIKGVVLLDALYGEAPKFAQWAASDFGREGFFVSTYTGSCAGGNRQVQKILAGTDLKPMRALPAKLNKGVVAFLPALPGAVHGDVVTRAFADNPIKEVLLRLPASYAFRLRAVRSAYKPPTVKQQQLILQQETALPDTAEPDPAQPATPLPQ